MTLFDMTTAPARWLGRFRPDLRYANDADAARLGGSASPAFRIMAAIAILYPLLASIVHARGPVTTGFDFWHLALRPFYDVVYAESLPFMITAVALGLVSPSLGVLFMTVMIPADLLAAAGTPELQSVWWLSRYLPGALAGRGASLILLWILVVEIPLLSRRWSLAWASRGPALPTLFDFAAARAVTTALLVFLWARVLPWLIQTTFTWTMLQNVPRWAPAPTWYYWWVLTIAATVVAPVASVWSGLPDPRLLLASAVEEAQRPARSTAAILVRECLAVAVLALLLGGVMTTKAATAAVISGLVVAGPALTILLPRMALPAVLAGVGRPVRWIAAMIAGLAAGGLVFALGYNALFETDYLVLTIAFAVAAIVFRIVLDAGRGVLRKAGALAALVAFTVLLLAGPAIALADDCSDATVGEARSCANHGIGAAFPMLGGAIAAVAGAIAMAKGRPDGPPLVFPSGYKLYQRRPLSDRVWGAIKGWLGANKYEQSGPRATSGVRG